MVIVGLEGGMATGFSCVTMILFSDKRSGSEREFGVGLILTASGACALVAWELLSERASSARC